MPRKRKPKFLDQLQDAILRKIEVASIRDLIFLTCWLSGAYVSYQGIGLVEKVTLDLPLDIASWLESWLTGATPKEELEIDWSRLLLSLVVSYKVVSAESEDVISGLSLIGTKLTIP